MIQKDSVDMKNPRLSIIITLYNNSEFIAKCLESVEKQKLNHIEVIIVDDGSTDEPRKYIQPYLSRNKLWRYYCHQNHGVGYTRNRGILLARGDYIGFLDSDDMVADFMYGDLLEIAIQNDACIVLSNFSKIDTDTGVEITDRKDRYYELHDLDASDRCKYIFGGKVFGMACASIFKRSLFIEAGQFFPSNVYHEDIFVLPRLYTLAKKISHVTTKGYIWRFRQASESHSINSRHILSILHALCDSENYLKKRGIYHDITREFTTYCIAYLNGLHKRILESNDSDGIKEYLMDLLAAVCRQVTKDKMKYVPLHRKSYGAIVSVIESSQNHSKAVVNSFRQKPIKLISCDIAFFPHKLYHTKTMLPVARELTAIGFSCVFINMSSAYGDEGAYSEFTDGEFTVISYEEFSSGYVEYCASVFMNDWDVKCALPIISRDNAKGIPTFGIVEGIQDFRDADTGRHRNAYQNVKYLIVSGEHDFNYFSPGFFKDIYIGGVPRLQALLNEKVIYPINQIALINSNFTYGVLEDQRIQWIDAAVRAAKKAGFHPIITRHPQDLGNLAGYEVSDQDMYTAIGASSVLISRFSSAIIESICLGKPAIYFNPGIETVDKFLDSKGAFDICVDENSLVKCLTNINSQISENENATRVRSRAVSFLSKHCGVSVDGASPSGIANFISNNIKPLHSEFVGTELRSLSHLINSSGHQSASSKTGKVLDKAFLSLNDDVFIASVITELIINPENALERIKSFEINKRLDDTFKKSGHENSHQRFLHTLKIAQSKVIAKIT